MPNASRWKLTYAVPLCVAGLMALAVGCLEGPPAERGTTRVCPDAADGDPMCFQQCAVVDPLDCTAADGEGTALVECMRDEMTGDYARVDGELVLPEDAESCVAFIVDAGECGDEGVDVQIDVVGEGEDACIDVNCAVDPPEDCE